MKRVNNRQKMFVKPRESVQKYILEASRVQKPDGRKQLGATVIRRKKARRVSH